MINSQTRKYKVKTHAHIVITDYNTPNIPLMTKVKKIRSTVLKELQKSSKLKVN